MTDTTNVAGSATGGATGSDLAQTIAQAVAAAVTTSLNEITEKLNSITENIQKSAASDDSHFEASVTGVHDPFENDRRTRLLFDQLQQLSIQAMQNAVETGNMVAKQAVRHADLAIDREWNEKGERAGGIDSKTS
jgi:hypothetical protein